MSATLVRKCDVCYLVIPAGAPVFMLSRFDLQRAGGSAAVITDPRDLCSESCFTTLTRGLFYAAMTPGSGVAPGVSPGPVPVPGARRISR